MSPPTVRGVSASLLVTPAEAASWDRRRYPHRTTQCELSIAKITVLRSGATDNFEQPLFVKAQVATAAGCYLAAGRNAGLRVDVVAVRGLVLRVGAGTACDR
jgi:hypothetical protein